METVSKHKKTPVMKKVLTVPMRNGNYNISVIRKERLGRVLTVPMRNGNFLFGDIIALGLTSSYRTYEEWKQMTDNHTASSVKSVLTVPMRNGNSPVTSAFFSLFWFLPYL